MSKYSPAGELLGPGEIEKASVGKLETYAELALKDGASDPEIVAAANSH